MPELSSMSYVIDFRNTLNCATIESAKPGQEICILVGLEKQPDTASITAKGKRSTDGKSFDITVLTNTGTDVQSWIWTELKTAIDIHRGK